MAVEVPAGTLLRPAHLLLAAFTPGGCASSDWVLLALAVTYSTQNAVRDFVSYLREVELQSTRRDLYIYNANAMC